MTTKQSQAKISILSENDKELIHNYSLSILSEAGFKVESEKALKVFINAGCKCNQDNNTVYLDREMISQAIKSAPSSIPIYNRNKNLVFELGKKETQARFGIGVTNLYYQDPFSDKIIEFERKHISSATALGNTLSEFDVISTPGILKDTTINPDLATSLEMIANSIKPIVLLVSDDNMFAPVLDMVTKLTGDLHDHPFVIPYFNPVTPLVINSSTSDKIFESIGRGLPFIYSNYGMYGATSPITPGGSLALLNAELLAGLVLSQLYKEGTPVILGSLPAGFNMTTMNSLYTPHTVLLNLSCAEMMSYYSIPHAGTSGSGPGMGADLSAADMLWMNHLTSCIGDVGLAPFVGGNFESMVFSPSTVVYSNHIIQQARNFSSGFSLDKESVGLDEIISIGPGGDYLTSNLTLQHFQEISNQDLNQLWNPISYENWINEGKRTADKILKEKTKEVMNNLIIPDDCDEITALGEEDIKTVNF